MKIIFLIQFFSLLLLASSYAQPDASSLKTWHDNKYSMFIHFGVYSELGGVWQGKTVERGYSEQIQAHAGSQKVKDTLPTNQEKPSKFNV
jgi:alpha-L-fucosidase